MKVLPKFLAVVFVLSVVGVSPDAFGQKSDQWIEFSSDVEYFRVSIPRLPTEETVNGLKTNYGDLDLTGKRYEASADGATYTIWSLTNPGDSAQQRKDPDRYLDACAQLIWDGLLKPDRDRLPNQRRETAAMSYTRELPGKTLPGREYAVTLGGMTGATQFYVASGLNVDAA